MTESNKALSDRNPEGRKNLIYVAVGYVILEIIGFIVKYTQTSHFDEWQVLRILLIGALLGVLFLGPTFARILVISLFGMGIGLGLIFAFLTFRNVGALQAVYWLAFAGASGFFVYLMTREETTHYILQHTEEIVDQEEHSKINY